MLTSTRRTLIGFALAFGLGTATATAQAADTDQIKATIGAFKDALSALDDTKMEALWAHDSDVTLINPRDKIVSVGWEAVSKDWKATFDHLSQLTVTQKDGPYIHISGNVAWASGVALETGKLKAGDAIPETQIFETNVFEKRGDRWLLVSHSAWFVPK
jgi:ketosteroid isomerase-like protein